MCIVAWGGGRGRRRKWLHFDQAFRWAWIAANHGNAFNSANCSHKLFSFCFAFYTKVIKSYDSRPPSSAENICIRFRMMNSVCFAFVFLLISFVFMIWSLVSSNSSCILYGTSIRYSVSFGNKCVRWEGSKEDVIRTNNWQIIFIATQFHIFLFSCLFFFLSFFLNFFLKFKSVLPNHTVEWRQNEMRERIIKIIKTEINTD